MRPCFWEVTSSMSTERPQWGRASPHGSMTGGSPAPGPPVQAVGAGEGVPGLQLTHPPAVAPPTARGCRGWGPYWRWGLRALSIARRSCPGAPPGQPLAHEQPSRPGFLLGPGSHKHVTVAKHVASDMSPASAARQATRCPWWLEPGAWHACVPPGLPAAPSHLLPVQGPAWAARRLPPWASSRRLPPPWPSPWDVGVEGVRLDGGDVTPLESWVTLHHQFLFGASASDAGVLGAPLQAPEVTALVATASGQQVRLSRAAEPPAPGHAPGGAVGAEPGQRVRVLGGEGCV